MCRIHFQRWHIIVTEQQITFILLHPGRWTAQWEPSEIISSLHDPPTYTTITPHHLLLSCVLSDSVMAAWWWSKINSPHLKKNQSKPILAQAYPKLHMAEREHWTEEAGKENCSVLSMRTKEMLGLKRTRGVWGQWRETDDLMAATHSSSDGNPPLWAAWWKWNSLSALPLVGSCTSYQPLLCSLLLFQALEIQLIPSIPVPGLL